MLGKVLFPPHRSRHVLFHVVAQLSMYFFFMSLVHIAFRGSFLAYNAKHLAAAALCFFLVMCVIGGFYMIFLFIDFGAADIASPEDCRNFNLSTGTRWIIRCGASCSALWNFTCLLLFYLRLRKITVMMKDQREHSRQDRLAMSNKYASAPTKSNTDQSQPTAGSAGTNATVATMESLSASAHSSRNAHVRVSLLACLNLQNVVFRGRCPATTKTTKTRMKTWRWET